MTAVTYRVEHVTRYAHAGPASMSQHVAYLRPRTLSHQRVVAHTLVVEPTGVDRYDRLDYFGNTAQHFAVSSPYADLRVVGQSVVEVRPRAPVPDPDSTPPWEVAQTAMTFVRRHACSGTEEFRYASPYVELAPDIAAFARESFLPGRPLLSAAMDLMHRIHETFTFDAKATSLTTPVTRVLALRQGVCQDFAHLQIACMRALGLAARYVSGYLLTDPPPGQPRLLGADASHAWLSVHCPGHGWVDVDPTNDVLPDLRHITLGWGRDYGDVSPLRGVVLGGGDHVLRVGVSVVPVGDATLRHDFRLR